MTRLVGGWIDGAGRQPAPVERGAEGPAGVVWPVGLHLGVDPHVRDAAEAGARLAQRRGQARRSPAPSTPRPPGPRGA